MISSSENQSGNLVKCLPYFNQKNGKCLEKGLGGSASGEGACHQGIFKCVQDSLGQGTTGPDPRQEGCCPVCQLLMEPLCLCDWEPICVDM